MRRQPRVYLAGPEVFLPDAAEVGARKKDLCARHGFLALLPSDNEVAADAGAEADRIIYRANSAMMQEADLAILNLTPFRGPSADVGTVFELGALSALGKPCFGYTNAGDDMLERVRRWSGAERSADDRRWRDSDGFAIEDFGNADNLMIDACLAEGGNALVRVDADGRLDALEGFEECLRLASGRFAARPPRCRRAAAPQGGVIAALASRAKSV